MRTDHGDIEALRTSLRAFVRGECALASEKLKENRVRTVWKVRTASHGWVLVKHYRYLRAMDLFRYRFLADKAQNEARNLDRLGALGVPVPRAFFWERWGRDQALFAGEFLEGAVPWPAAPDAALVAKLAAAVRALHAVRFCHGDLHLGNVLVRAGEVYLIDFHGGFFAPFLPRSVEIAALGTLVHSLQVRGCEDLVAPFLAAYAGGENPRLLLRVKAASVRHGKRRFASRSRRCVVDSTRFTVERHGGVRTFRRRDVSPGTVEALVRAKPEVDGGGNEVVAHEGRRFVRIRASYSLAEGVARLVAGGRLLRVWCALHALAVAKITAPKGIACVQRRSFGALQEETLLVEMPPDGTWSAASLADAPAVPGIEALRRTFGNRA